jgi:hypothetical protein
MIGLRDLAHLIPRLKWNETRKTPAVVGLREKLGYLRDRGPILDRVEELEILHYLRGTDDHSTIPVPKEMPLYRRGNHP